MMYFDTHAHYDDPRFDEDRAERLSHLSADGVALVLNPGASLDTSRRAVRLAQDYPHVYAAVGIHPHDADTLTESVKNELIALAAHPKVKAVGEIGLDYHYDYSPRDVQQACFRQLLDMASQLDLPVIIHDREAHEDTVRILREFPHLSCVFHCYSGSAETARRLIDWGYYISFTGVVTFKNARRALEAAAAVPLDRLMIETDAPYMAPEPHRGERNDARYVAHVAQKIAEIRGMSVEELAKATMDNGKRFFRIP